MKPFARTIDAAKKHAVSSTLDRVDWNAELLRGDLEKSVQQLKRGRVTAGAVAGLSKHVDSKRVSRLEFGSGAVAVRYEARREGGEPAKGVFHWAEINGGRSPGATQVVPVPAPNGAFFRVFSRERGARGLLGPGPWIGSACWTLDRISQSNRGYECVVSERWS